MKHSPKDQLAKPDCATQNHDEYQLTNEQMDHIKKFIEQVGGIENARQALLTLDQIQKAA